MKGSILTIFPEIHAIFEKSAYKMVRINLGSNKRIIGIEIPSSSVDIFIGKLIKK